MMLSTLCPRARLERTQQGSRATALCLQNPPRPQTLTKKFSSPASSKLSLKVNVFVHTFDHSSGVQENSSSYAGSGCNFPESFL